MFELHAIERVLWDCLDGLYEGDEERLARAFLPEAHLCAVYDGAPTVISREGWLGALLSWVSAKASGQRSANTVHWIDIAATTAVARVSCSLSPNRFTETLGFLKGGAGRKQIAKKFRVVPKV